MPEFICKLGTADGQIVERVLNGDDEAALRHDLSEQDLLVLSMKRKLGLSLPFLGGKRRISANEFLVFNQELRALIQAGMPILGSLDMLIERRKNPVFKQALREIREDVQGGSSLSEAFQARGELFPALYATSLASGERSGEIGTVLERYIDYARSVAAVRKKILTAAAYPAILITAMVILVAVMVIYVFPSFDELFATMEADIPIATVILLAVSNWFADYYVWVFLGAVGVAVGLVLWRRTENGRRAFDTLQFRVPIIGDVMHKYAVTRFTRTLGTLLAGGIPMVTSLQIASRTVGNSVFAERLEDAARKVREGEALWESLEETALLSDMATGMIKVGESSGAMTEMLDNVSSFYEAEIESRIQTLLSLMEPILLLVMAIIVGVIILAVYMPLLSAFSNSNM